MYALDEYMRMFEGTVVPIMLSGCEAEATDEDVQRRVNVLEVN